MKVKIITAVSDLRNPGLHKLEASLIRLNYDYKIIHNPEIGWDWSGWRSVRNWLDTEESQQYTHIIYTDGFDTIALAPPEETEAALTKLLQPNPNAFIYSCEKHWFPHEGRDVAPKDWIEYHTMYINKIQYTSLPPTHIWRFVNGGQFAGTIQAVKDWYDLAPKTRNNQAYGNAFYAEDKENKLILDFNCELFQTLSHSGIMHGSPDEFTVKEKRLINNNTGSKPCFAHANGIKHQSELKIMYDIIN